ncbi:MAG TPA: hypothetical protein VML50_14615, partial [Anaeromyxobacter sp.]|nr:hypothetical protein [Anaeromyxobacter sp.]
IRFLADAPSDGSTILLPFLASDAQISPSSPRFSYDAYVEDIYFGGATQLPGTASYNAFSPSLAVTGIAAPVQPNTFAAGKIVVDPVEWAQTPARGLMMVNVDNHSGARQAQLLPATGTGQAATARAGAAQRPAGAGTATAQR